MSQVEQVAPMTKRHVLFLCTGNPARSQMAEGFLRVLGGDRYEVASAGTELREGRDRPMRARAVPGRRARRGVRG